VSIPEGLTMSVENGWSSPSYGVRAGIRVVVLRGRVTGPQTATFRFGLVRRSDEELKNLARVLPSAASASLVGM
jgi:hypothetical protein